MTNEDQIAALFASANPVPSLDVFDPVEPLDMDRLEKRTERSSGMTDTKTYNGKVATPNRWPRLAMLVAIPVVAVVVALVLLTDRNGSVASPVSVATAFMGATAEHDGKAAWELFAPDTEERLLGLADWTSTYDLDRAIGWDVINQGCEERSSGSDGTVVDCPYLFENDWMRALGIEPTSGNSEFLVADGQIQSVTETGQADESGIFEAYRAFRAFVRENHPDDDSTMFGPGDQFLRNPESIALFEQYTDEFAASTAAPSTTTASATALRSIGALDPGTYYIPEGPFSPGRFTFTVPAGWATTGEGWVTKDLEDEPINFNSGGNNVLLVTWIVSHVYTDVCNWRGNLIDVGTTVDGLAAALTAQEGRIASAPTDVMLGGFPAKRIELTVPAELDIATCDSGFIRFWPDPGPDETGGLCCVAAGTTDVVYVVDVDGNTFAVVARHTAASSAEDRAELEDIVDSIRIDPPGASSTTSP